ncbi:MAG: TIR domain-containing protein [Pseudonocardiaceae bacterium]
MRGRRERGAGRYSYDAFMSYSHTADALLAPELQRLIRRVGRPWFRRSTLRVFRDQTNLPMSESLWSSIEAALAQSEYFVLMASPGAADSAWVAREVQYWRRHRERSTFRIVLTAGQIEWDGGDFDWDRTDALPQAALSGWFPDQPGWADVRSPAGDRVQRNQRNDRLRDAARTLAAPMYGMDKDQLDGEDERESRRARRTLQGGITALTLLTVVAVTAALVAVGQLNQARTQARISLARQLAATSDTELSARLDVANLLAVKAFQTDPNPQTRAALFRAVTASGNLVRYLPFGGYVSKLAGSADGITVVAGLRDGRVLRWRLTDPAPQPLFRLPTDVAQLSVSADGGVVAASGGTMAMLVRPGHEPSSLPVASGQQPGAVAVSPSGRTVVLSGEENQFQGRTSMVVYDVGSATVRRLQFNPHPELMVAPSSIVASDDEVFLLDGAYGTWQRRGLTDWSLRESSDAHFGVHNYALGASGDGGSFSYSNGAATIPVWRTGGPTDPDRPPATAQAPIATPNALALNADGSRLAVADSGAIFVTPVLAPGAPRDAPVQLVGTGSINTDGLRFLGPGGNRVISASADRVTLWDLNQSDRLGHSTAIPMRPACNACGGPNVAVAPDGTRIVAVDGSGDAGVVASLDRRDQYQLPRDTAFSMLYGPSLWDRDGRRVTILITPLSGGHGTPLPEGLPAVVRTLPAGQRAGGVKAAGLSADGRSVLVVELDGGIDNLDIATGALRQITPGPRQPEDASAPQIAAAAVNTTSDLVAVADDKALKVLDAHTGTVRGTMPATGVRHVSFTGSRLLVQRDTGELEVWDERATIRQRVIAGDPEFIWPPVTSSQGSLVARPRSDSSIVLADLDTGAVLTTLTPSVSVPGLRVGVAFSADGAQLVTVTEGDDSDQGLVVHRDISDEALVRTACATAGRDLTATEWQTLVGTDPPNDLSCG